MGALPGFDLSSIPTTDGKTAKPGLNISMSSSDEPGHTGWVDKSGTLGTPLDLSKGVPDVTIAVILSPKALHADKGLSLGTIRHEMVHVRHKMKVLEALRAWQTSGRKSGFEEWLEGYAKKSNMSALNLALVKKGAKDAAANTEVLAYVEGLPTTSTAAGPPPETPHCRSSSSLARSRLDGFTPGSRPTLPCDRRP